MAQKHLRHSWDVMPDSIKKYQRQKNKENKRLEVVEILDRRLFLNHPFKPPPSTWDFQSAGGSRSAQFLSFLMIVRLVPHGDFLCLLL